MSETNFDFTVSSNPSFCTVWPETDAAREWFREWTEGNLLGDGESFHVEYRYIHDLCNGMLDHGFTITKDGKSMVRSADGELVLE